MHVSPTTALGVDQVPSVAELGLEGVRPARLDWGHSICRTRTGPGTCPTPLRDPDGVHHSMLRKHARWSAFPRRLSFVVIDESDVS